MSHRIIPLVTAALLMGAACSGGGKLKTRTAPEPPGTSAPAFELTSHTGERVSLASLHERGPAVVVFYRGFW